MKKQKIIKWEYVTQPFDVLVHPATVKRVHTPLGWSLSPHYTNGEFYLHLRPCVQGVDEYGVVVRYLYCTRDGRFFVRDKDGWGEQIPQNSKNPRRAKSCGGGKDCPAMAHFGSKYCHRCVAFAWLDVPEDVRNQISDIRCQKPEVKWEVDHLDTNHKNWTADNLQWVTAEENRRRGKIARRMRKIGLDPKLLTPTLCKGIYTLPDSFNNLYWVDIFIQCFTDCCRLSTAEMTIDSIRQMVAEALDDVRGFIKTYTVI